MLTVLKSPVTTNAASGREVSVLSIIPNSWSSAVLLSASGGIYTAVITTDVNSLGRRKARHVVHSLIVLELLIVTHYLPQQMEFAVTKNIFNREYIFWWYALMVIELIVYKTSGKITSGPKPRGKQFTILDREKRHFFAFHKLKTKNIWNSLL